MIKQFKKIGILTSGGDAPGMNAAVRAVTRYAIRRGIEVMGIYEGYQGLIDGGDSVKEFDAHSVANIITKGGTMLYSARCLDFKKEEGMQQAIATCRRLGIEGLITIGGDGTFRGASDLCKRGIPCIGIPASIDNDITASDYSIGFDTALNTTQQMVDRLRDTCESHARCNVVEVMGRNAGYIAMNSAIAVGATAVAVLERPFDEAACMQKIREERALGKRNFIVIVAEGLVGYSEGLAKRIEAETGVETKFARLAHVVRGGSPTQRDRLTAARMGVAAVDLLLSGIENVYVCERNGRITCVDIAEAITMDRAYKSTFTPGHSFKPEEIEKYPEHVQQRIRDFVHTRNEEFTELLRTFDGISSYTETVEK